MATADPAVIIHNIGELGNILQTVSVIMGIGMFVGGLFQMKRYGEMRTFMSHQMTLWAPLSMMLAGTIFLLLPSVISLSLNSFWSTSNPLHYNTSGYGWDEYVPAVVIFVRLIGVGAFMRGVSLFARAGGHQGQPGIMSKALLHVIGGILCMHIIGTVDLLKSILDIY